MRAVDFKCAVLVLLLALPAFLHSQSDPSPQLEALFQRGATALKNGEMAQAETSFRKATEMAPDFAPAFLDLGLTQLRQGKLLEAAKSIRKSLTLEPNSPSAHLFLGIAEYQSSHPQQAVNNLQLAIQEDPKNVQALTWLGIVELNTGRPDKAVGPLDRAAELAPKDEVVLDYRVQAHMGVARQSYSQLAEIDPGSWRLHRLDAVIDSQALEHKQAIDEYRKAIQIAPGQPDLYEGLGWEYRALDQNEDATEAFKKELSLTPGNPIAMYNLASTEVQNGHPEQALPMLEKVVKIYNVPTQADYYLGRALALTNRFSEAAIEFQRATQLTGEMQRRAWYQLSQAYRHLGKTTDARAALVQYQKLREQADQQSARQVQDWRKLNAYGTTTQSDSTTPSQAFSGNTAAPK